MSLGEVWIPGEDSEETYTGEAGESKFSMQYYRNTARRFQEVLNQLDRAAGQVATVIADPNVPQSLVGELSAMLDEFDWKKSVLKGTAEAINAGAATINAVGGRFPELSIPSGLGAVPLLLPAGTVAAIGVAAGLITWGVTWLAGVNERLKLALQYEQMTPDTRDRVAAAQVQVESAAAAAQDSPLASIAGIVKWAALGLAAYLAYNAFTSSRKGE